MEQGCTKYDIPIIIFISIVIIIIIIIIVVVSTLPVCYKRPAFVYRDSAQGCSVHVPAAAYVFAPIKSEAAHIRPLSGA